MIGSILGDIAGSRFEYDDYKSKEFDLFGDDNIPRPACEYTDDTVMTVAVAAALLEFEQGIADEGAFKQALVAAMHHYGGARMNAGFGNRFYQWLKDRSTQPYYSCGNGSAMRVSPVGWYAGSLEEAERIAAWTAEVTHNHPEGIKGAQAAAAAVYMARRGEAKAAIRRYIERNYYPDGFTLSLDEIRPSYEYDATCQGTVPVALLAFFEAEGFEDAVKNAVSIGGDSDTVAAITGGAAEAFYGVPRNMQEKALSFLDDEMKGVTLRFARRYCRSWPCRKNRQ